MKLVLTEEELEALGLSGQGLKNFKRSIEDASHALAVAAKPVMLQVLDNNKSNGYPAAGVLFGLICYAAYEASIGINVIGRYAGDPDSFREGLSHTCCVMFKRWLDQFLALAAADGSSVN